MLFSAKPQPPVTEYPIGGVYATQAMLLSTAVALLTNAIAANAFITTPTHQYQVLPASVGTYACIRGAFLCNASPRANIVCNASPRANIIDNYKSIPKVDDGLGPLDFGITDSLSVPDDARPTLVDTISNPRDLLALILLVFGGCTVAYHNIFGIYGPSYEMTQRVSVCLGFVNMIAVLLQLQSSYLISKRSRLGLVDDAALTLYAGLYSAAASWLALRTSSFCPAWLTSASLDNVLPWFAAMIFSYSLAAPVITLIDHFDDSNDGDCLSTKMVQASRLLSPTQHDLTNIPTELSETELFRTKGLLFIGILGCVFVPACLAFAFQGEEWWQRVIANHPKQPYLNLQTPFSRCLQLRHR